MIRGDKKPKSSFWDECPLEPLSKTFDEDAIRDHPFAFRKIQEDPERRGGRAGDDQPGIGLSPSYVQYGDGLGGRLKTIPFVLARTRSNS